MVKSRRKGKKVKKQKNKSQKMTDPVMIGLESHCFSGPKDDEFYTIVSMELAIPLPMLSCLPHHTTWPTAILCDELPYHTKPESGQRDRSAQADLHPRLPACFGFVPNTLEAPPADNTKRHTAQ